MKILVTGGAGFIGSHLVDALIAKKHKVIVIDNLSSGKKEFVNSKATFVENDILEPKVVEKVINKFGPIYAIYHLAAQKSVTASVRDPIYDAKINIIGGLRVFEAAKKYHINKIIFSSTGGAIYGDGVHLPTSENDKIAPESPYGIAKFSLENYLRFYNSFGITTQTLRFANVYGPRQDPYGEAGVVAIFSQLARQGKDLTIFGDGKQTRDFIYVGDVVDACCKTLDYSKSGVWNIGTGTETSVNTIAKHIIKMCSKKIKVNYKAGRVGELKRSCISPHNALHDLGWASKVDLISGITKTYQSF